jgi:hypothetical protein
MRKSIQFKQSLNVHLQRMPGINSGEHRRNQFITLKTYRDLMVIVQVEY